MISILVGMTANADGYDGAAAAAWAEANYGNQTGSLKCADFASKALNAGGVNVYNASTTRLRQQLLNTGLFQEITPQVAYKGSYVFVDENSWIKPGDLIFYQLSTSTDYCHVAVICHSGNNGSGKNVWWISQWNPSAHGKWAAGYTWSDSSYSYKNGNIKYSILHYTGNGGSSTSSCGCSDANAGYYKVTASSGLSVNSGHNFNSKYGELSYGQVVYVKRASGTGGASGTYGHIDYGGREGYIAMKFMTPASNAEICAAVGHDTQTVAGTAATCTSSGLTEGTRCARCGATITAQQTIPASGHTFGRWNEKTAATCTAQATHVAVCSVCGNEYGVSVSYGDLASHTYGDWTVVREATTTETGLKQRTCTVCGNSEQQEIEKLTPSVDENAPQILMETVTARAGSNVDVTISLKNNPGINSVRIAVGYDTNAMTLTAVKDAGLLGELSNDPSQMSKSPYTIVWEGDKFDKNFTDNGTIATLTFAVKEGVSEGTYPITISYDEDKYDIMDVNMEIVHLDVVNGGVAVKDVIIGDADGDGEVTPRDRVILSRYLSNWEGYAEKINLAAADTDGDGIITTRDRVVLSRYLSKWNGYTALPYKK